MKSFTTAILAFGAALVSAQTTMAPNTTSIITTSMTSTYTDCTDVPDVTLTSTNTVTVTYCSSCTMSHGPKTDHTTVYTTVYSDVCPTGTSSGMLTPVTYTVTESCTGATPTWSSGTDYVPQGFTTTVGVCTVCEGQPTMTLTYPTSSPPAALATTTTVPCSSCEGGMSPTPAPAAATTTPAATTPANTDYAAPSSSVAAPSAWGNTTGITPYTPGANGAGMVGVSQGAFALAVAAIAGAAFLL